MHRLWNQADALTGEVIDAAVEVQKHFGIGVLESIYQKCLGQELRLRGHDVKLEFSVPIRYKGLVFDEKLRVDILVDDCLIVECKAVDEDKVNMERFKAQTLSYLKLLEIPLGLVVNFGDYRLGKRGIARVILKGAADRDETAQKADCGVASEAGVVATSLFAQSACDDSRLRSTKFHKENEV